MYSKEFTRDFSIIMEDVWHYAICFGLEKEFGFKAPRRSPLVFYIRDGAIEVWSDSQAIRRLVGQINAASRRQPARFIKALKDYRRLLKGFDKFFKVKYARDRKTLEQFLHKVYEIITAFTVMYYLAEQTADGSMAKNLARRLRQKDSFYEDCDRFLRRSLKNIFPALRGLEATILADEVEAPPSAAILRQRQHNFVLVPGLCARVETIEKFSRENKGFVFSATKFNPAASVLKGQSAFRGMVVGRVRIIRVKDRLPLFKKGEILVAPMTTPDYLAAMKKARAFITDEGGALCHAAIIARELKKPCLVGTKFATKVLHDGDLVEVDADKGVVRIIKKK